MWANPGSAGPSMDNVYQSTYLTDARDAEFQRGAAMWQAATEPWATGVVPQPASASMFAGGPADVGDDAAPGGIASLSGETIPTEHFTFNNMVPFFKGNATQNVDVDRGGARLDAMTGRQPFYEHKREQEAFFGPTANLAYVNGAPDNSELYKSRVAAPTAQRNFFPIAQERVGPGLNAGYSATPEGGFHNPSTLDFVRPKTTNELRALNNPKETYEKPIAAPPRYGSKRADLGVVQKNRPDTAFEQTQDQWLQTTGAFRRPTERPSVVLKATAKAGTSDTEYAGAAYGAQSRPGAGADADYGKASICVYDNARRTTQTKTNVSNLRSLVKAIVAPLLDVFRRTPKEYLVESARTYGNMSIQVPNKLTVYDPVAHAMRTTIKETTIHDAEIGNLRGPEAGTVHYDDATRTTVRETTPTTDDTRNLSSGTYRVTVYNTEEIARRTHREATADALNIAGFKGEARNHVGAYVSTDVDLKLTQKQFVSDNDHYGGAGAQAEFAPMSHEAAEAMEVDGTREMQLAKAGYTPNAQGANAGMDSADVNVDVRKIMSDAVAAREFGNITKAYVVGDKPIEACEVTKQATTLPQVDADRLDPAILASIKTNPYAQKINPILEC